MRTQRTKLSRRRGEHPQNIGYNFARTTSMLTQNQRRRLQLLFSHRRYFRSRCGNFSTAWLTGIFRVSPAMRCGDNHHQLIVPDYTLMQLVRYPVAFNNG